MSTLPIQAVDLAGVGGAERLVAPLAIQPAGHSTFAQALGEGLADVSRKVAEADAMVRAYALDDSIPVHQVTYALEQARLSVELMMQVRNRLVEGYQEIMRMQV